MFKDNAEPQHSTSPTGPFKVQPSANNNLLGKRSKKTSFMDEEDVSADDMPKKKVPLTAAEKMRIVSHYVSHMCHVSPITGDTSGDVSRQEHRRLQPQSHIF